MMSKVDGRKRKLKTRTITDKYKMLKEVGKGEPSASISKNYAIITKQTFYGWLKVKTKTYSEVKKNKTSIKRVWMRVSTYEDLAICGF